MRDTRRDEQVRNTMCNTRQARSEDFAMGANPGVWGRSPHRLAIFTIFQQK